MKSRSVLGMVIALGVLGEGCGLQIAHRENQQKDTAPQAQTEAQQELPDMDSQPVVLEEGGDGVVVSAEVEGVLRQAELDLEQQIGGSVADGTPVRVQCRTL